MAKFYARNVCVCVEPTATCSGCDTVVVELWKPLPSIPFYSLLFPSILRARDVQNSVNTFPGALTPAALTGFACSRPQYAIGTGSFRQMRPGLWMMLVVLLLVCGISPTVSAPNGDTVVSISPANGDAVVFSQEWLAEFSSGSIGCQTRGTDGYAWRRAGFGSNINSEFKP